MLKATSFQSWQHLRDVSNLQMAELVVTVNIEHVRVLVFLAEIPGTNHLVKPQDSTRE